MAAAAAQIFQNNNTEVSRQQIQAAFAKAVELRALHAVLMQGNSSTNLRLPSSASPSISHPSSHLSAQDYPVFTPSYEVEPLPGYHHIRFENRSFSEICDGYWIEVGEDDEAVHYDYKKQNSSSWKGLNSGLVSRESHLSPAED